MKRVQNTVRYIQAVHGDRIPSSSLGQDFELQRIFVVSVDVEGMPLRNGSTDFSATIGGVPLLLDLFAEFNVHATFFVTSNAAKNTANTLKEVVNRNHEIGFHGYRSDRLSIDEQYLNMKKATEKISHYLNVTPRGFRAHRYSINEKMLRLLIKLGYLYDSSVVPSSKLLTRHYFPNAPRTPYRPSLDNICKKGQASIMEIPISTLPMTKLPLGLSYIMLFGLNVYKLFLPSLKEEIVTFYLHPYDLFCLHPFSDVSSVFRLTYRKANGKGSSILRELFEYFEKWIPKYICAKEVLYRISANSDSD